MALEPVPTDIPAQGGVARMSDPEKIVETGSAEHGRAAAIVEATTHYNDPQVLARASVGLGEPMVGISASALRPEELLETRGW